MTGIVACQPAAQLTKQTQGVNSKKSQQQPYVILISLDGFKWDYVDRFQPPHLTEFINDGVKASSLVPVFPSKTFPNHYTIATGMYPDKNGIVGNAFYSYDNEQLYTVGNRKIVEDGKFYNGTPIWVLAEQSKMLAASYFFVGSEAAIQGVRPSYYHVYDGKIKNETRINQAVNWLQLPAKTRPHLITLYFSDLDDVGHKYGPNNDTEIKNAIMTLDQQLGDLFKMVNETTLPVNIIIVSDHGMADMPTQNLISTTSIKNDTLFKMVDNGAIINIHPNKGIQIDSAYQYLKQKESHFKVYKTENTPGFEYTPKNKDWGSLQLIPDDGFYFSNDNRIASLIKNNTQITGVHGFDPALKDMHGIFYANGPAFKNGIELPSFKNIHIYPLICSILNLEIPANIDGDLKYVKNALKNQN
jgi:predicted AlkP superfamily pyrophosphatase or phosphodiesterase